MQSNVLFHAEMQEFELRNGFDLNENLHIIKIKRVIS